MGIDLYYLPPSEKIFKEVKKKAMELWLEIDSDNDKYGYATSEINRIKDLENVEDNLMSIFSMLDIHNQSILLGRLSSEARAAILERMEVDGWFDFSNKE